MHSHLAIILSLQLQNNSSLSGLFSEMEEIEPSSKGKRYIYKPGTNSRCNIWMITKPNTTNEFIELAQAIWEEKSYKGAFVYIEDDYENVGRISVKMEDDDSNQYELKRKHVRATLVNNILWDAINTGHSDAIKHLKLMPFTVLNELPDVLLLAKPMQSAKDFFDLATDINTNLQGIYYQVQDPMFAELISKQLVLMGKKIADLEKTNAHPKYMEIIDYEEPAKVCEATEEWIKEGDIPPKEYHFKIVIEDTSLDSNKEDCKVYNCTLGPSGKMP